MNVQCPHCGKPVQVSGLGRKRLDIPLQNICDALQSCRSVVVAAQELGCSPAYIFAALKKNGLTPKDVLNQGSGHDH